MEQQHKNILQRNHVYLVNELDFKNTDLLDHLFAKGLVSLDDRERIEVCSI